MEEESIKIDTHVRKKMFSKEKIKLNSVNDLIKIPINQLLTLNVNILSGNLYKRIYEEALKQENSKIQNNSNITESPNKSAKKVKSNKKFAKPIKNMNNIKINEIMDEGVPNYNVRQEKDLSSSSEEKEKEKDEEKPIVTLKKSKSKSSLLSQSDKKIQRNLVHYFNKTNNTDIKQTLNKNTNKSINKTIYKGIMNKPITKSLNKTLTNVNVNNRIAKRDIRPFKLNDDEEYNTNNPNDKIYYNTFYNTKVNNQTNTGDNYNSNYKYTYSNNNSSYKEFNNSNNSCLTMDNCYNTQPRRFYSGNVNLFRNNLNLSIPLKKINFVVNYVTSFGEEVGVIGSIPILGCWEENKAIKLKWYNGHIWKGGIYASVDYFRDFEFKFVILQDNKVTKWEPGENNIFNYNIMVNLIKNRRSGTYNKYNYDYNVNNAELTFICKWNYF